MFSLKNSYLVMPVIAFLLLFIFYLGPMENLDDNKYENGLDTVIDLFPEINGNKNGMLGGLYRRKKKKQILNKNKYKKHRKPIK